MKESGQLNGCLTFIVNVEVFLVSAALAYITIDPDSIGDYILFAILWFVIGRILIPLIESFIFMLIDR